MTTIWMDVDAALVSVPVNKFPLIDSTDFKTIEDAVVYNQAGLALFWNFTTTAGITTVTPVTPTTAGVYDWTDFTTSGMYGIEMPASGGASANNDTEGFGHFTGSATGILPWAGPKIGFRAAALNNAMIDGGDVLDVSLTEIGGVAQSATDLKDFADTGYDPATNKVQGVLLVDTLTTYTGNTPQTGDVFPKFSGMTVLANWLRALGRKDAADATALTEINTGGGTYDEAVDSQESIADSIAATAPLEFNPDASSTIVTGTLISGTFADTATNNASYWVVDDAGAGIEVITEMNLGSGRSATSFLINARFSSGASRIVEFWAFNYTTAAYVKFSAGTASTEMRNSLTDVDYEFSLSAPFTNPDSVIGEVKIKFLSAQSNATDRLSIDLVAVTGEASGVTSPQAIADAVGNSEWGVSMNHIPKFAGHVWYVNGVTGNDANSGLFPDQALATISGAIAGSTAGDFIKVFATTYLEAVTLNLDGLELHCEIGATITGAAGVPLTVSADSCIIDNVILTPAAGQKGLVITGNNNRTTLTDINGGLVGAEVSGTGNTLSNTNATDYTQTAFDIKNAGAILRVCTAKTVNAGTRAFYLSNTLADRSILGVCESVNNTLAAFEVVTGVTNASFFGCAESETCGARVDNGTNTSWRQHSTTDEFLETATTLTDMKGATFSTATDSLEAIRNRGDIAWITGGGGGLTQILNVQPVLPNDIDLADTATVRTGLILINSLDDLPSTAEITPGTISIDRKAIGGTSWSAVVIDAAMSEQAGMVYFDEVFDTGTGYVEGDSIRVTFKSVSITADANTHEIADANGIIFQTSIRQTMRGTDGANTTTPPTSAAVTTAVWSDTLTTYIDGMAGKRVKGLTAVPTYEGLVNDVAATTTSVKTTLIGFGDTFFNDSLLNVELSTDNYQGKPVATYTSATGVFTVDEPFMTAPADTLRVAVTVTHIHPITQIQAGLATVTKQDALDVKVGTPVVDLAADLAAVKVVDDTIQLVTDQFAFTVANQVDSNVLAIDDDATAATYLKAHARRAIPVTFSGGSTTTGIIATIDGGSPHTSDTQYVDRILVFSAPLALKDQVLGVTGYIGSTGTFTVTASTAAIGADAVAVLV